MSTPSEPLNTLAEAAGPLADALLGRCSAMTEPMTEARLASIEARAAAWNDGLPANPLEGWYLIDDLVEVLAALRQAWRERDEAKATEATLRARVAELEDWLSECVAQGTSRNADGNLDSCCSSTWADGLRELAAMGRVEIVWERGRNVVARWKERANA